MIMRIRNRRMSIGTTIGLAGLAFLLSLSYSMTAFAAPFEFTPTAKKAFDKMVSAASSSVSASLKKQYAELQTLQRQDLDWDSKINSLHYKNEENEGKLRKAIREIDSAKIKALENAAASLKKQHEPLFELYETQRTQLSLARSFKNKNLTSALSVQVEMTKAAVQAAKKKQSNKNAELKKAKADANAKMKQLRRMLDDNDATESKIKAAKAAASTYKSMFTTEGKVLGGAVRGGDTSGTAASFTRMIAHQRQILVQKYLIHSYEERIAGAIAKTETKMRSF
jgi:hypothetical protein